MRPSGFQGFMISSVRISDINCIEVNALPWEKHPACLIERRSAEVNYYEGSIFPLSYGVTIFMLTYNIPGLDNYGY